MTEPAPLPDWCTVGARAYDVGRDTCHPVTITKITATTVRAVARSDEVSAYRRGNLARRGTGDWDFASLAAPDDPRVLEMQQRARLRTAAYETTMAVGAWERDGGVVAARAVIARVQQWIDRQTAPSG